MLLAGRPGYSAAAVDYGQLPKNLDEVLAGSCPMVASYGGKDTTLKGAGEKVRLSLERAGAVYDYKAYPNARHGFINRITALSPLTVLMKVGGVGYDHDSAIDAKQRILAFFDEHLRVNASVEVGEGQSRA